MEAIIGILKASELGFGFLVRNSQINEFLWRRLEKYFLNCRANRLQLAGMLSLFIANIRLRRNRRFGRRHNTEKAEKTQLKNEVKERKLEFMTKSRAPP